MFRFPQTDLTLGKLRPALVIGKLPGAYNDWLICMVSSQTHHYLAGFDDLIEDRSADFTKSGLKMSSVVRVGRLAVVDASMLLGTIGEIDKARLKRIKTNLSNWLKK